MRILYLTPDLFGPPSGIARYCRMVCRALTQSGHRVLTVSLLDQPGARSEAKAAFPVMRYIPCGGNRRQFIKRALRCLRMRPQVILVGHPNFAPLGWALGKMSRAKVVNFIYGIDAWEPLSKTRRRTLSAGDRIISISRFTAMRSEQVNGIPMGKVRILHNCLDPHFQALETVQAEGMLLLTVARISLGEQYKGHDVVIRALPMLLERFPELVYEVVGGGDGRSKLEELAVQEGVANAVRFRGVVSEEELVACYQNASVFVMPSRSEGFGFVFLEAMAQGVPAIGGNVDATPEVIVDGETGYTIDPLSPEELAQATTRLLEDPALRERIGKAARRHAAHTFGFEHFKEQLSGFLAELAPDFKPRTSSSCEVRRP